eukprot:3074918-Rhodomonas_salina.1
MQRFAPTCPLPEEGGRGGSGGESLEDESPRETQICTAIPALIPRTGESGNLAQGLSQTKLEERLTDHGALYWWT